MYILEYIAICLYWIFRRVLSTNVKHEQMIHSLNLSYKLNFQPFTVLMKTQNFNLLQTVLQLEDERLQETNFFGLKDLNYYLFSIYWGSMFNILLQSCFMFTSV